MNRPMNRPTSLLGLLDDPRPFALLRRRTPGHDDSVVELLLGPVTPVSAWPTFPTRGWRSSPSGRSGSAVSMCATTAPRCWC